MYSNEVIIKNISKIMNKQGLSQIDLSNQLSVSKSYVSMLLAGKRNFSQKVIAKLATVLNVSPDELTENEVVNHSEYQIHLRGKIESGQAKEALYDWMIDMDDFVRLSRMKTKESAIQNGTRKS